MNDLKIKVLFVSGFGPVVQDQKTSKKLYMDTLGLPLEVMADGYVHTEGLEDGYLHTERLEGVKHFALLPLSKAAQMCFGSAEWPKEFSVPQAWLELDVEDVEAATKELEQQGYKLFVSGRKEPWGQIVTRLLSPEGLLIGITYTPWMRDNKK